MSYQVQALDAHGSTVPIASLGSRQQGDQTYTQQLATCADQRGQGERPVSEAAGLAECRRLVSIEHPEVADESRYGPLAVFADQNRFLAVLGSRTNPAATPFLCSLFPQRAVKGLSNGTPDGRGGRAAVNKDQLFFSLTARAKAGVSLWAGGRLDEPVSSITYTFPDGHRAQATISGDYWVLTYRTDRPLLDSRPMTELPPVEVDVITAARKRIHYTIPFTAETACDQEFPQRDC